MNYHFIVTAAVEDYAARFSQSEPSLLTELRKETYGKTPIPQMLSGPLEGAFLKFVVQMSKAKRVLEIGTFTGYSALMMAEALPKNGELITCEIDRNMADFAQRYFDRSPYGKKIKLKIGPAVKTISKLKPGFDLIFVDADKENYPKYYDRGMDLLKRGGVMLFDNALWGGRVLHPETPDDKGIHKTNEKATKDPRALNVLVTLRDGIQVVWKKK